MKSAHVTEMPSPEEYTHRCRLCWPGVDESSDDSSGPESSDSSRGAEDSGVSSSGFMGADQRSSWVKMKDSCEPTELRGAVC